MLFINFVSCCLRRPVDVGRPRSLDNYGCLGLVLHWLNGKMGQKTLQQLFGLTPACTSRYLNLGLSALERCLKKLPQSRISWPSLHDMDRFSDMIISRYSNLEDTYIFGFADGTTMPVQNSSNGLEQNAYYNGKHHLLCLVAFVRG